MSDWRDEGPVADAARDALFSPTTAETPTMRERLERRMYSDSDLEWQFLKEKAKERYRQRLNAVLREMLEPSEGMITAAIKADPGLREIWQSMIEHILNETQD